MKKMIFNKSKFNKKKFKKIYKKIKLYKKLLNQHTWILKTLLRKKNNENNNQKQRKKSRLKLK